jgi:hypothetical protein
MAAKANTQSSRRVQMDLPEPSLVRLQALKEKTEASSYAEVMKNALRLYEDIIAQTENGNEFMLKKKDGGEIILYRIF